MCIRDSGCTSDTSPPRSLPWRRRHRIEQSAYYHLREDGARSSLVRVVITRGAAYESDTRGRIYVGPFVTPPQAVHTGGSVIPYGSSEVPVPFLAGTTSSLRRTAVSYTHLRAHETGRNLVCRLLLETK